MRRGLVGAIAIVLGGCIGQAEETSSARAIGPVDAQVQWKPIGAACPAGFVQLGTDPAPQTDGRQAVCVHRSFCEARPAVGDYCAQAPKSVTTTDAATFWSDFLVTCPAVGRIERATTPGTARIRVAKRAFPLDARNVQTRWAADGGWEPCLTNPVGAGLRDASCDAGEGTVCSADWNAVVECVETWVDDRRSGTSEAVQSFQALSRDWCDAGICEDDPALGPACLEDRALVPPRIEDEVPRCDGWRTLVDVAGAPMCLSDEYCAAQAPGLYCDAAPTGVADTGAWGALTDADAITPGALVVAGSIAIECGRDASGRATTALYPCTSATCVGNAVGFGCVDTSCELRNEGTDLDALYAAGDDEAIGEIEGAYCSAQRAGNLLDCALVSAYDAELDAFTARLLPMGIRRCTGATPVCVQNEPGIADECGAVDPAGAQ